MKKQNEFYFYIFSFSKWEAINIYTRLLEETITGMKNNTNKIVSFYEFNFKEIRIIIIKLLKIILFIFYKNQIDKNFFIFGSFSLINILICILLSKFGFQTIFLIHDVHAHSGSGLKTLLTNFLTRVVCNSKTKIVVFSNYSLRSLHKKFPNSRRNNHIISLYSFLEESKLYSLIQLNLLKNISRENSKIIIFGRNEAYKDFDFIYKKANQEKFFKGKWIFLGVGMSNLNKNYIHKSERVFIKDVYYSSEELIENLIRSSLTLIAYKEMTQSAVIYDSMALGLDIYTLHYPFIKEISGYPGLKIFKTKKLMFESLRSYKSLTLDKRLKYIEYYQLNFSKSLSKMASLSLINSLIKN